MMNKDMGQMDQEMVMAVESLFLIVNQRGRYPIAMLAGMLSQDETRIRAAVLRLCQLSNLFVFDEAENTLETIDSYIPLDSLAIRHQLPLALRQKVSISRFFVTGSTNSDLENIALTDANCDAGDLAAIAVAEMQQGGKGRRAKRWVSPLAKNLYFSFKYQFAAESLPYLSSLSLRVGFALLASLQTLGIEDARLKWPNDIWVNGQKLAGILVESTMTAKAMTVIIGIGVNNQQDQLQEIIGNHPTNCEAILGQPLDRNVLIGILTTKLYTLCQQISEAPESLEPLNTSWPDNSVFYGKKVRLISDKTEIIGTEVGIDDNGALLIQDEAGQISGIYSGELSLRAFE